MGVAGISKDLSKESRAANDQIDQDTCIGTRIIQIYVYGYIHFKGLTTKKLCKFCTTVYGTMLFQAWHISYRTPTYAHIIRHSLFFR